MPNPTADESTATVEPLEDELDPSEASLVERNLRLTPEQRIDQLVRAVEFIRAMRAAVAKKLGRSH